MERGQHRLSDVFHHQGKETIHPASKHPSSLAKWHSRSKGPNICLSIVAFSWFAFSNTRLENADVNRPKATKKDTPGVVPGVVRILFIWRVWKELGGGHMRPLSVMKWMFVCPCVLHLIFLYQKKLGRNLDHLQGMVVESLAFLRVPTSSRAGAWSHPVEKWWSSRIESGPSRWKQSINKIYKFSAKTRANHPPKLIKVDIKFLAKASCQHLWRHVWCCARNASHWYSKGFGVPPRFNAYKSPSFLGAWRFPCWARHP